MIYQTSQTTSNKYKKKIKLYKSKCIAIITIYLKINKFSIY